MHAFVFAVCWLQHDMVARTSVAAIAQLAQDMESAKQLTLQNSEVS